MIEARPSEVKGCSAGFTRLGRLLLIPSLTLLLLSACTEGIEALRERDAEHVFVRGAAYSYEERATLDVTVGDVAVFLEGEMITLTGVGIVVGLSGTGDTGDAFAGVGAFLKTLPDLRAPPDAKMSEGSIALVSVESQISPSLGAAAGLVGASVRPLGNAKSLEGGMLLETSLVEAGKRDVMALGVGPVLTVRVDEKGQPIKTPKLGRLMKIEVRDRARIGATIELRIDPSWPEVLAEVERVLVSSFPSCRVKTIPPQRVKITLPRDPLSRPTDPHRKIQNLPIRPGSARISRILCSQEGGIFVSVGGRLHFGRGTFLLGGGIRVVSMARKGRMIAPASGDEGGQETDLAIVEVTVDGEKRRIVTLRWVKQVVRVLDRLGVAYPEILKLLNMAAGAGVLHGEIILLPEDRLKNLKGKGQKVR
ncbi:MAG: flagellar basal body P-ring protein FlgI [Planctomycetota bacterium]|jgi:flagellar P-ring protein precursor FlgI